MFSGKEIQIGAETYVVPAISLGQLRSGLLEKLKEHDKLVGEGDKLFETLTLRGEIILQAFKRNYPDFPEDKFFEFLDMENTGRLWLIVMGLSGFNSGEVPAATAQVNGISSPSTEA
jgi:hypothetical protein